MSKANKANKSNYDQAGRLTPDELARERQKMEPRAVPQERITNRAPSRQRGGESESTPPRSAPEE